MSSHVCVYIDFFCGAYLSDDGFLGASTKQTSGHTTGPIGNTIHPAYPHGPHPAHSTRSTSSAYDLSSSSVDIQGVHWPSGTRVTRSMTRMSRMVGSPEGLLIRHIACPNGLLEHSVRGDLHTYTHVFSLLTGSAQEINGGGRRSGGRLKYSPQTHSWKYLIFIDWTPWSRPFNVRGSGTALHTSAKNGGM
jgi:hypothetical protein